MTNEQSQPRERDAMPVPGKQSQDSNSRIETSIPPPSNGSLYRYKPLPPGYIRLVILMPGTDKIEVDLEYVPLNMVDNFYNALSYAWGKPDPPREVTCVSGGKITVTPNLYDALRSLRADLPNRIWIDQISINQQDLRERGEQVKLMGSIYSRAGNVIVWLGQETWSNKDLASDFRSFLVFCCNQGIRANEHPTQSMSVAQREEADKIPQTVWDSVSRVIMNGYFDRRWIIQEVVKARGMAQVACGGTFFVWDHLEIVAEYLSYDYIPSHAVSPELREFCGNVQVLRAIRERLTSTKPRKNSPLWTLQYLVNLTRMFEGADPRDKIYAVLGLLDSPLHCVPQHVDVDYTTPFETLWRSVFVYGMVKQSDLTPLNLCRASHDANWPSWLLPPIEKVGVPPSLVTHRSDYDASKGVSSSVREIESRPDSLQFKTRRLGSITRISPADNFPMPADRVLRQAEVTLDDLYAHIASQRAFVFGDRTNVRLEELENFAEAFLCDVWDGRLSSAGTNKRLQAFDMMQDVFPDDEHEADVASQLFAQSFSRSRHMRLCLLQPAAAFADAVPEPWLGWVPRGAVCGDGLYIINGFYMPMLVREVKPGRFRFLGICYVHGMMDGQAFRVEGAEDEYIEVV